MELTMTRSDAAPRADAVLLLEILRSAASGMFPVPLLERLIDGLEVRR
jgi:hypothetical protein